MTTDSVIKVCHVTSVHHRYDVRILHKECQSLAKNGYQVYLLVVDDRPDEPVGSVEIVSTSFVARNRFQRIILAKRIIKRKMKEIDADIYHFHDPELLSTAAWVKRMGKAVIFDFHEDASRQILFKSWIPRILRPVVSRIYRRYEAHWARCFDALITVTPAFVDRLKTVNPETYLVTNYPILYTDDQLIPKHKERAICFAGGISEQWNHVNIVKAIETIPDVTYHLAGSCSPTYLNQLKGLEGWEKVKYHGKIPHEQVKPVYERSRIGMTLLSYQTQVGQEGTLGNTKIFEYMNASLPFICSNNRVWRRIVDQHRCGVAVDPDNVADIRAAIEYLLDHEEEAEGMGSRARSAAVSEYNWQTQANQLLCIYNGLMTQRNDMNGNP